MNTEMIQMCGLPNVNNPFKLLMFSTNKFSFKVKTTKAMKLIQRLEKLAKYNGNKMYLLYLKVLYIRHAFASDLFLSASESLKSAVILKDNVDYEILFE